MFISNLGKRGEDLACLYLQKNGYKILKRNFRSRLGEIDIIALEEQTVVFIEVKTRFSKQFGPPEEAVTPWKIRSIIKTAQYFQMLHPKLPESLRIDVVAITLAPNGETKEIKLIKNVTS